MTEDTFPQPKLLEVPRPHWHKQNPWKDKILYVPLIELADCTFKVGQDNTWTMIEEVADWVQYGVMLDAYILDSVVLTGGVRYGPEGRHYLSPGFSLPKLIELKAKYTPTKKKKPDPREGS